MSDPARIHLTVATVVERDGRFLMVRERDKTSGEEVINQPAGHVEAGETLQEAALRETLEETGWQVELTGLLGFNHYRSPHNGKTYYRVSFIARPVAPVAGAELDSDIIDVNWLRPEELEKTSGLRSPMVLSDIKKHLKKVFYPLDFIDNIEP